MTIRTKNGLAPIYSRMMMIITETFHQAATRDSVNAVDPIPTDTDALTLFVRNHVKDRYPKQGE